MQDKYFDEIKNNLINDEIYSKVKDYSKKLILEIDKRYNRRTLFRKKQFYICLVMKKCSYCRYN